MHAAAEGKSTLGIPQSVGKEFVEASHGTDVKSLPKYADGKHKSPNPGAAHIDDYHDDDDNDREMRARADHMFNQGLLNDKGRAKIHDQINMLKKARRPQLGPPVPPASQIAPKVPADPRTFSNPSGGIPHDGTGEGASDPSGGGTIPAERINTSDANRATLRR